MTEPLKGLTKLHSRLRCVANGKSDVNRIRAQQNGAVKVRTRKRDEDAIPSLTTAMRMAGPKTLGREGELHRIKKGEKQTELESDVEVSVFVLLNRETARDPKFVSHRVGRIGTATVPLSQLKTLNDDPAVQLLELGETLKHPDAQRGSTTPDDPAAGRFDHLNKGPVQGLDKVSLDQAGDDILVGIIDVGGLDFCHPDFMDDAGKTRIVSIWDQGGDAFDPPKGRDYGSEILASDITFAIKESAGAKFSAYDLAPQSQQVQGSHATHVASIAAGRSGVCKRSRIAAVMIALPDADLQRAKSFYDTTRIVDALAYLYDLAAAEGLKGVAVNISLGTNGGPHDASELLSRWIDTSLAEPGRVVCVAAGNAGQETAQHEGDVGYWSGRVHASGRIPAAGLRKDLEWVVVGNGLEDISENELEIWYRAEDEFAVELFTPGGQRIGPIAPGEQVENLVLPDRTVVSIYNVLSDPKNGDNRISLYLSPFMGDPIVGITAGSWKVRIAGKVIRNGAFNAWIERDDPSRGQTAQWRLPSFFGPNSFVDDSTLSSLACGPRITGVANYDEARELLNVTSSQGPTRDGRFKPEIAAPGTNIVAACGFHPTTQWIEMTGTSMASPYVTGVSALMLSLNPDLTAAQIGGIIRRTSSPLPGSSYEWRNDSGFGVIDAPACLREAVRISLPVNDLTKDIKL